MDEYMQKVYDQMMNQRINKESMVDDVLDCKPLNLYVDNTLMQEAFGSCSVHSEHTEISQKEIFIKEIIKIRSKLSEFLNDSNMLLKILDAQSIRETIRDLRWEIKTIKLNQDISELDIIKFQEKMYEQKEF